jgi:hypothetical protein
MANLQVALPLPTDRTSRGPLLFHSAEGTLRVCWDYENDEGAVKWAVMEFAAVASFEWLSPVAITSSADVGSSYSSMTVITDSSLARDAEKRARIVPFTHMRNPLTLQECHLYFDEGGFLRVVAEAWTSKTGGPEVVTSAVFVA